MANGRETASRTEICSKNKKLLKSFLSFSKKFHTRSEYSTSHQKQPLPLPSRPSPGLSCPVLRMGITISHLFRSDPA
jgi:hypothetical protein